MDAQMLIGVAQAMLIGILLIVCLNLYLIFRLKDLDPFAKWDPNAVNGALLLLFIIAGLPAAFLSSMAWSKEMVMTYNAASEHGQVIDNMFWWTMAVAVFVTVLTNILLFYFSWKYRYREGQKALYYPHNNRIEVLWTVVPAIVLTALVLRGVIVWNDVTGPAPDNALNIELNGKQFAWTARYPGSDLEFGETSVFLINEAKGNSLGFNLDDKRGFDDLVVSELVIPVNTDIELKIRSRDVLHSATLMHFRVKMDAVPGMTTRFHFKPTITTADMRLQTGNDAFEYEMSCQQICGGGHWNMRLPVRVVTMEEYKAWLAQQKTFIASYRELNPEKPAAPAPATQETPAPDQTASAQTVVH
ncbi:MAG: cytochrome c oxidase subunit II [Bacteroidia bacterium]|nr:cytochrome c oxidase subunit II [Bacteroidia bacterium]